MHSLQIGKKENRSIWSGFLFELLLCVGKGWYAASPTARKAGLFKIIPYVLTVADCAHAGRALARTVGDGGKGFVLF